MRGVGHRHERAVRCDGREWRDRRTRLTRTAKSCGSDAAVLASSCADSFLCSDGGNRAVHRGEHEVSRKAIAQGRPECSCCPVCSCARLFAQIARETAGAASTRSSLRPLIGEGRKFQQTSGNSCREIAKSHPRHCKRRDLSGEALAKAEAIHCHPAHGKMDCVAEPVIGRRFAPTRWLAMTPRLAEMP
jgi:hypothetical protein